MIWDNLAKFAMQKQISTFPIAVDGPSLDIFYHACLRFRWFMNKPQITMQNLGNWQLIKKNLPKCWQESGDKYRESEWCRSRTDDWSRMLSDTVLLVNVSSSTDFCHHLVLNVNINIRDPGSRSPPIHHQNRDYTVYDRNPKL